MTLTPYSKENDQCKVINEIQPKFDRTFYDDCADYVVRLTTPQYAATCYLSLIQKI